MSVQNRLAKAHRSLSTGIFTPLEPYQRIRTGESFSFGEMVAIQWESSASVVSTARRDRRGGLGRIERELASDCTACDKQLATARRITQIPKSNSAHTSRTAGNESELPSRCHCRSMERVAGNRNSSWYPSSLATSLGEKRRYPQGVSK